MQTKTFIALGMAGAILAASGFAQAADQAARNELDQRNRIWTMQGEADGSYTGDAERNQVQTRTQEQMRTRTQEQVRTRTYPGSDTGSRYGQGYESRQGGRGFGSGPGGGGRSSGTGGSGGGRR